MQLISVLKDTLSTVRRQRSLWFFGFFLGAGGGGVSGSRKGAGPTPEWLWPVLAVAALVGVLVLVLHVVSEAALIDGVRRTRRGERYSIGFGLRNGWRFFTRLAGVKLGWAGAELVTLAAICVPLGAVMLARGPLWAGAIGSAAIGLTLLPWVLTLTLIYEYAMRAVVVEDLGVRSAVRAGFEFLRGRLAASLGLAVVAGLGQAGAGAIGFLLMLPVVALAGIVYLAAGTIPAIVVGAAFGIPIGTCVAGALGTYRSAIWTHGYLADRALPL